MTPSLDKLQADALAISATGSPKVRTFALDTVAYLRSLAPVPPPPASNPYVSEPLAGSIANQAFWYQSPTADARYFSWITDPDGSRWLRVTAPACKSPGVLADGTVVTSSSVTGQLVGLESHVSLSQIPFVHSGWKSGDPSQAVYPGGAVGQREELWERFTIRWPAGYRPTLGTQNATAERHFDRVSQLALKQAVSAVVIVEGVGGTSSTVNGIAFDTAPSTVSQVLLQFPGGGTSESGFGVRRQIIAAADYALGRPYTIVTRWIYDPDPTIGLCQLWVDGVKKVDENRSTQYLRPDGTRGYAEDVGVYNYRHWANWASSVDYAQLVWGPDAASIGFTP